MPAKKRTAGEILEEYKRDPGSLTLTELNWIQRELARRQKTTRPSKATRADYANVKERSAKIDAERSRLGRDIGPLPKVVDPARRKRSAGNLEIFCREYFPELFFWPWSSSHRIALEKCERAARRGERFALAMPRGSGKTTIVQAAVLWAVLYALQEFAVIIASDAGHAEKVLESLKTLLETNDRLLGDFPEVCYPIRRLERIPQRASGQLLDGKSTLIGWKSEEIILPTVEGYPTSGAIIRATGITGAGIRGNIHTRADGRTVRPGMVLLDDPQTDESAASPSQVAERERLINGAILGMSGPGQSIAAIMPCTVVRASDLSDRMLDRQLNPAWQGERTGMIDGWPKREDLWEQFKKINDDALRAGAGPGEATAFYVANREAMDEGATATWASRKSADDASALQHAMLKYFSIGKRAFFAEYQNDPLPEDAEASEAPTAEQVAAKANGIPRGIVPRDATCLVAFIDVQKELLYWTVAAFWPGFNGHVVAYGTYPDQHRDYFAKSDVRQTLVKSEKVAGFEGSLRKGLDSLSSLLLGREWNQENGSVKTIELCLVDAHWGESTDLVKTFCRQSPFRNVLTPSFGIFVGASSLPMNSRPRKPGERRGKDWYSPKPETGQAAHVNFDANSWKTALMERWRQAIGGPGCLTIFGEPADHRLYADHQCAEYPVLTTGRGRSVTEWKIRPNRPDNDLLDTTVGCCVAASMRGISVAELPGAAVPGPRVVRKLSELFAAGKHHG